MAASSIEDDDQLIVIDLEAVLVDFSGKGNASDVRLDTLRIWAQIRVLPFTIKMVDMGWILGKKFGTVVAVSHRNNKIVDEHLRIHVDHRVDKPLRKDVSFTPTGSKNELSSSSMKNCPIFVFVGHTTEKSAAFPKKCRWCPSPSTLGCHHTGRRSMPLWVLFADILTLGGGASDDHRGEDAG